MSKFWVFGDSFCEYNDNWIKIIADKLKVDKVETRGLGGSGLTYCYSQLIKEVDNITEDDSVLIGISHHTRHLFSDGFYCSAGIVDKDPNDLKNLNPTQVKAAVDYFKYLYDDNLSILLSQCVIGHIINSIVRKLPTSKVAIIRTVGLNEDTVYYKSIPYQYRFVFKHRYTLFTILQEYASSKGVPCTGEELINSSFYSNRNHWVDDKEYEEYFFNRIDELLEPLGLSKNNKN